MTADEFCTSHGLQRVDFMKVDTEGHEVDVLRWTPIFGQWGALFKV